MLARVGSVRRPRPAAGWSQPMISSCPLCGASQREGARFCGACGYALAAAPPAFCAACGAPRTPDDTFCTSCGAPRAGGSPGAAGAWPAPAPVAAYGVAPPAPADTRAAWARGLLIAFIVAAVVTIVYDLLKIGLLASAQDGDFLTADDASALDTAEAFVGFGSIIVWLACAVLFLMWVHRVHRNVRAIGTAGLREGDGWAVGMWFVPVVNLFRPFQMLNDVDKASGLGAAARLPGWRDRARGSALLGWWWGSWLAAGFLGGGVLRTSLLNENTVEEIQPLQASPSLFYDEAEPL